MKFRVFLIPLFLAIPLFALMPNYSDAHLAGTSDIIVIGRVIGAGHGEFIQGHNVCTPWKVEVERNVVGKSAEEITFYTRGGQLPYANEMLWVEDQALPQEGGRALIFLEQLDGKWFINGQILGYRQIDKGRIFGIQEDEYVKYISLLALGIDAPMPEREIATIHTTASISGFSPSSGPAGDGAVTVVISGSGFGSSTGTVEFTYYQWPGYSPNFLDPSWTTIHSWSDTEIRTDIPSHASSGPIRVTPTSSPAVVSSSAFNVTFGYTKKKWPAATPVNVTLMHNDSSYPILGCGTAIQNALNTWSTAGAWFRYNWGGTTTDGDPEFNAGSNGRNSIHFGYFSGSSPPLGVCQIYFSYSHPNWHIYEMDIRFNLAEPWSAGDPVTANDVESIALHEAGHGLQLMDVYGILDIGKVMYGVSMIGSAARSLSSADNDGIIYIYGSDGSTGIENSEFGESSMELNLSSNPARGQATFTIDIANSEYVRVEVFDLLGRCIAVPFEGDLNVGTHAFIWQPEDNSPNGVYFLRASTANVSSNRKFALIR